MPGRLPQPDYAKLAASLKELGTQVERVPNIPLPADDRGLREVTDTLKAMSTKIDNLTTNINNLNTTVDDLKTKVQQFQTM
jgi:peptidoglycan hydrolase CwlO-like protein